MRIWPKRRKVASVMARGRNGHNGSRTHQPGVGPAAPPQQSKRLGVANGIYAAEMRQGIWACFVCEFLTAGCSCCMEQFGPDRHALNRAISAHSGIQSENDSPKPESWSTLER